MPDTLPPEFVQALDATASRRGVFGQPVIFHLETGSTNDDAARWAEKGAPEGAMVLALAQRAGRGRLGRQWFSPPGAGLYVSLVCRESRVAPLITLAAGVAVAHGVRAATGLPVQIKWPNDIVVADATVPGRRRKLAGILSEASSGPDGVQHVVVGIGINVRPAAYPLDIARVTTSLEGELDRPVDAARVLAETLAALNEQVQEARSGNTAEVLARWRALAPSAIGAAVMWTAEGGARQGTTLGVDDQGALLVRADHGVERIIAGELRWL